MGRAIAYGALAVGVLDILDAFVFFGLRGVSPIVILQSMRRAFWAAPLTKEASGTAALGLVFHFLIATSIVTTYVLASRRWPAPARGPFVYGPLYGILVYGVMNLVVVPLSAAAVGSKTWPVVVNGLLIHVFGWGFRLRWRRGQWDGAESESPRCTAPTGIHGRDEQQPRREAMPAKHKDPRTFPARGPSQRPAATYSPTRSRVQYHQR